METNTRMEKEPTLAIPEQKEQAESRTTLGRWRNFFRGKIRQVFSLPKLTLNDWRFAYEKKENVR